MIKDFLGQPWHFWAGCIVAGTLCYLFQQPLWTAAIAGAAWGLLHGVIFDK